MTSGLDALMDRMDEMRWPELAQPYLGALRDAVTLVRERFEPCGIVAAGSILRGTGHAGSDLDIYVIHHAPVRQRIQRRLRGVPCELFVNPPGQTERYFAMGQCDGTPSTAHMLATGHVLYDADGTVARLRSLATAILAAGPEYGDPRQLYQRYAVVDVFENALDIVVSDPETASLLLGQALERAIALRFRLANQWQPRAKDTLSALDTLDPDLAAILRRYWRNGDLTGRIDLAREIVRRTAGATGSFEWETEPESVEP